MKLYRVNVVHWRETIFGESASLTFSLKDGDGEPTIVSYTW
jgi:hypothetical protein